MSWRLVSDQGVVANSQQLVELGNYCILVIQSGTCHVMLSSVLNICSFHSPQRDALISPRDKMSQKCVLSSHQGVLVDNL